MQNKNSTKTVARQTRTVKWQLLHISLLREYLDLEFREANVPFYDPERAIDDFVFLVMLCGNDFLPHLPSMDIGEGAVHTLIGLYKELLPEMGGFLTDKGKLNVERAEVRHCDTAALHSSVTTPGPRHCAVSFSLRHACCATLSCCSVAWARWRTMCLRSARPRRRR